MQKCKITNQSFEILTLEKEMIEKLKINIPQIAPHERRKMRLAWRNEMSLYSRTCSATEKTIISIHHKNTPFPVYSRDYWWSDSWNAKTYAQNYNEKKGFFEQYKELQNKVPHPAVISYQSENSEYTNCASENRDCYLIFSSDFNRNCYYSRWIQNCVDCIDCYLTKKCELVYEGVYSKNCYNSAFIEYCSTVSNSYFLYDCKNCQDCFMSSNLRNAKYVFKNQQLSKEEYEENIKKHLPLESQNYSYLLTEFNKIKGDKKDFHFFGRVENCESTDYLTDCQNGYKSKFLDTCQNMAHCSNIIASKYCVDIDFGGEAELSYNSLEAFPYPYHSISTVSCYGGDYVEYSELCINSSNVFGCVGLRRGKYCILNKEYSEKEYYEIRNHIIQKMKLKETYGEFFPTDLSPFGYNETDAGSEYPLTREEALSQGFNWHNKNETEEQVYAEVPRSITQTPDAITEQVFSCLTSKKGYKIIPQELKLYRQIGVSIPFECPDVRIRRRNAQLNPS